MPDKQAIKQQRYSKFLYNEKKHAAKIEISPEVILERDKIIRTPWTELRGITKYQERPRLILMPPRLRQKSTKFTKWAITDSRQAITLPNKKVTQQNEYDLVPTGKTPHGKEAYGKKGGKLTPEGFQNNKREDMKHQCNG